MQATPIQPTPIQPTPMQTTPIQPTPMQSTPAQLAATPMQATPEQQVELLKKGKKPISPNVEIIKNNSNQSKKINKQNKLREKVKFVKKYQIENMFYKNQDIETPPKTPKEFIKLVSRNVIVHSRDVFGPLDYTPEQFIYLVLSKVEIPPSHENNKENKENHSIKLRMKNLIIRSIIETKSKIDPKVYSSIITKLLESIKLQIPTKKKLKYIFNNPEILGNPIIMDKIIDSETERPNLLQKIMMRRKSIKNSGNYNNLPRLRNLSQQDWRVMFSKTNGNTLDAKLMKHTKNNSLLSASELFLTAI
jgi:tRNA(adenine34) deaminase